MELNTAPATVDEVKAVVVETLGVQDRAGSIDAATPLMGSMPELDSLAVVELVLALEDRFGITVEGDDVTADVFESVAALADFVDSKRS